MVALVVTLVGAASACTLPQSEICADYVRCQQAVDDDVDTSPWEEGGSCWNLPSVARECDAQCSAALDALRTLPDAPDTCDLP